MRDLYAKGALSGPAAVLMEPLIGTLKKLTEFFEFFPDIASVKTINLAI